MNVKKFGWLLLVALTLVLTACGKSQSQNGKLKVMTTFYPVYDFTKNIVGDEGTVDLLIGAGSEPHEYELSAKGRAMIQDSDVFVYENENMETWVPNLLKSMKDKKTKVIDATKGMVLLPGLEEEHEHEGGEEHHHEYDPHLWLSPHRAMKMVESIRDQLVAAYPDKKKTFEKNAQAYLKKLQALDQAYQDGLKDAKQKNFVTQHAAFRYLALDYGLNQVAISGISPDSEPSAARLRELTEYIKKNEIKVIYFEENASKSLAKTLSSEAGVELAVLNPLESLTDQEMKNGEDYVSVMKENLKALEKTTSQAGKDIQPEHEEDSKTVQKGYFEDSQVKDRSLANYAGDWKSVYPYLQDGTLDQVFDYKAKLNPTMTAAEYKEYYTKGYQTDIDRLKIDKDSMEFYQKGSSKKYTYKYVGKHILTYKKGNRGVRYLFEAKESDAGDFKYVQFSDHEITPVKAAHFHIFHGGKSQEALYDELENWPTYFPSNLSGLEVAQEMLAH